MRGDFSIGLRVAPRAASSSANLVVFGGVCSARPRDRVLSDTASGQRGERKGAPAYVAHGPTRMAPRFPRAPRGCQDVTMKTPSAGRYLGASTHSTRIDCNRQATSL